ncbi:MAG TPA: GNAT family N-acetyltransferase [Thermoplasmata archaeon]|nr:GNAT family N-acetyltransferase [Thermoplasmata archaeon]
MAPGRGNSPLHPARTVHLVRMTDAERDEALRQEAEEYGAAKARAGFWPREGCTDRAREEIAGLLGSDPASRGHAFFVGVDGAGRRVGWVWYGPVPGSGTAAGKRWLFQIAVDEPLRGNGYGRGLLEAVERRLAEEGMHELSLNVFRWNTTAVGLYERSGYEVVSQAAGNLEMRKRLSRA